MPLFVVSDCDLRPSPPCPARFNLAAHCLDNGPAEKIALTVAHAVNDPAPLRLSYGELRKRVLRAAGGLLAKGVKPGDRVMLRLGHSPDFPIFFLGATAIGAVPVPSSTMLSAREAAYVAEDTSARLIIAHEGFEGAPAPLSPRRRLTGRRQISLPRARMISPISSTLPALPARRKASPMRIVQPGRGG